MYLFMKSSENNHLKYKLIIRYLYLHYKTLFSFYLRVIYPSGVQKKRQGSTLTLFLYFTDNLSGAGKLVTVSLSYHFYD